MVTRQKTYAALDLGTNNCRLSMAIKNNASYKNFKIIFRYATQIRLGENLNSLGYLNDNAINKAINALLICKDYLIKYNVFKGRYVATEACRIAKNNTYFLEQVYKKTGIALEIISKEEEAKLASLACIDFIKKISKPVLIFDIGGGSTQLSFIKDFQYSTNFVDDIVGLDVGVINMWERFNHVQDHKNYFDFIKSYVKTKIKNTIIEKKLEHLLNVEYQLIGTSGTATTLAAIYLNLSSYDRRKTDGLWIQQTGVATIIEKLIATDKQTMSNNPCIGAERSDLLLAGCAILSAIMDIWCSEKIKIADRGLREGILFQLIRNN